MDIGGLLVAGGIGAILLAVVQAVINRKKLGADTAAVLTKAATELVQPLRDRIRELEQQLDRVKDKAEDLEQQLDDCQDRCQAKDALIAEFTRQSPKEIP